MENFGPQVAAAVLAACQENVVESGQAFARAFGGGSQLTIGDAGTLDSDMPLDEARGQGLVFRLTVGKSAALILVSESTGLLPSWYRRPGDADASKLTMLAQELGKLLLPQDIAVEECAAAAVDDLSTALARSGCADGAAIVRLALTNSDGVPGSLALIWPVTNPAAVFDAAPAVESGAIGEKIAEAVAESTAAEASLNQLPRYSRSLLRIKVPVIVTLAAKKQAVSKIVEIVPGSIIQFDKPCDAPLEMEVGTQGVAKGECVKVGEKFGFRITSLTLPAERFDRIGATAN